ncbi:hypothetical protein BpHYR1_041622 [Brachionus plicatilis]|uniref:Uncharacterized protein n=1 Tax=Brachionus plicatilis TaxID=10195 RepID=A0A3M7RHN0_BRAPC|nr:hypothetical protein BpHYR1_041622 [Brachionus plicatilis]
MLLALKLEKLGRGLELYNPIISGFSKKHNYQFREKEAYYCVTKINQIKYVGRNKPKELKVYYGGTTLLVMKFKFSLAIQTKIVELSAYKKTMKQKNDRPDKFILMLMLVEKILMVDLNLYCGILFMRFMKDFAKIITKLNKESFLRPYIISMLI